MSNRYQRPTGIPSDMGGTDTNLDQRLSMVIDLLECAPLGGLETALDIGLGKGQLARWLAQKGKKVTGIGLELESYDLDVQALQKEYGIDLVECSAEKMPFDDGSFDVVIMSHILEHVPNVGLVLQEVKRVLSKKGYLFLFVPPQDQLIAAGHISTGWNIGQVMYVLLVNGFDVKGGKFIQYGYNICAFVQPSDISLPPLRGDRGDIHILNDSGLWPAPIVTKDGYNDNFYGNLKAINWPGAETFVTRNYSRKHLLFNRVIGLLPDTLKIKIGGLLSFIGQKLLEDGIRKDLYNPAVLKG